MANCVQNLGHFVGPQLKKLSGLEIQKKKLRNFPEEIKKGIGYALGFAQKGEMHPSAKPLKGLGSGVLEVVENAKSGTYRAVYTVQLGNEIYVLHTFQKKSKTGIATPKREIDLIKQRLILAKEYDKNR